MLKMLRKKSFLQIFHIVVKYMTNYYKIRRNFKTVKERRNFKTVKEEKNHEKEF